MLQLPGRANRNQRLRDFAEELENLQSQIPFKMSSRGWCYLLETRRLVNKDQFDRCENVINECRTKGYLPVDFVAEDSGRDFHGIEKLTEETYSEYIVGWLNASLACGQFYTPDWWDEEQYYIQMLVEKIDLRTLFEPVCQHYKIPIATAKGWSSILQRAEYARRFKEAEDRGKTGVLLYCGDHDPDGLRISDFIRGNLQDIADIRWEDGEEGYDPTDLVIDRFGLNYDFIEVNHLTSIDNLLTGSGKNLASPSHPNHYQPYVQSYLHSYGAKKWEANSVVAVPTKGQILCQEAIEKYLGAGSRRRFDAKRSDALSDINELIGEGSTAGDLVREAIEELSEEEGEDEGEDSEDQGDDQ